MQRRSRLKKKEQDALSAWKVEDSLDLYGIDRWGRGMFTVDANGDMCLDNQKGDADINLKALVDEIHMRGMQLPVLIRFTDVLRQRIQEIGDAFLNAIREEKYQGEYRPVYPIKVNQHRHVLEDIMAQGRDYRFGLECGSKAELLLAIAMQADPEALIICNGFKDQGYVELALHARRMGRKIFLVVEKFSELELILQLAREMTVEPLIGLRMKLSSRGKGMWESSGGEKSKFGLRASEIIAAVKLLRKKRKLNYLQLLHFHIGSQIPDIQRIKTALREAANVMTEVSGMGAPIQYVDVGGGLAVDYDGSHTNFSSSANYGPREYAADVVNALHVACEEAGVSHPTIVTECGRALVAHHSVLVVEAVSAQEVPAMTEVPSVTARMPEVVRRMREIYDAFTGKNFQEIYHDAIEARREALMLFSLRHLSLQHRAIVEDLFWGTCHRILGYVRQLDYIPDELSGLERLLSATYFCNFSLFQSVPDHWAIKQLFPVAPLHRLHEKPTCNAILADITCDSDGVMDRFVDLRDVKDFLPLHSLRAGERYYLGIFLVGAYQEILGDLHNLFGDTHVIHVSSSATGYVIDKAVEGERIEDVMEYVQFTRDDILARIRTRIEEALKRGDLTLEDSAPLLRRFAKGLDTYTYLNTDAPTRKKSAR